MKIRVSLKYIVNDSRYLVLIENEKYDFIYNTIRYLSSVKSSITLCYFS